MSRTAAQLPAHELEDFQRAARGLLATGLVTDTWPVSRGLLPLVRRFEAVLRAELGQVFGWALRVDQRSARVVRTPLRPDVRRGARLTERGSSNINRPFRPRDYAMLCLVLAALEAEGPQSTIRRLAAGVERVRAGREDLAVDFAKPADRRCFVTAAAWLVHVGVLTESSDSDTFRFIDDGDADALYSIDHDLARRLLGPLPVVIDPDDGLAGLAEARLQSEHSARQRLARRLLEQTAVYYAELDDDERQVLTDRRVELSARLERLTGCQVETRAEGLALIDPDARIRLGAHPSFPGTGNVGNVAAAYAGALLAASDDLPQHPDDVPVGRRVPAAATDAAWGRVLAAHGNGLTKGWTDATDELRGEATALLAELGLIELVDTHTDADAARDAEDVHVSDGHAPVVVLRPLAARFDYPNLPEPGLFEETS